jgi:hypothetical protein
MTVRLGTPLSLTWTYPPELAVDRFEVQVNGRDWVTVGTAHEWRVPPLWIGTHTLSVRACDASECGDPGSVDVIVTPLLPKVANPNVIPGVLPLTAHQCLEVAEAYTLLVRPGQKLSQKEKEYIAARLKGLTLGDVLNAMDETYIQVAGGLIS